MNSRQLDEEAIFRVARKIDDRDAQAEYLDQVCSGDEALRQRVEALLEVHEKEQDFLRSSSEPTSTVHPSVISERPGTTIGRYKLMEQIGEGGMGAVFVAEQERPIRRKVALKVIKPGMDSKAVVARFEAERQALAMMDHPNIAKVFDAGSTESGRPYFVMELVRGVPVTDYCDKHKLSVPERLALFMQICQAVQHAHQKGIIHRDIKPTNVLVANHDGQPVPKVIDFGVAKATNQRLTERTIYTRLQQIIGTPMYMSPEQAELSGLDIDTRTDVYSLGVLLYEMVTGSTPFDKKLLQEAAYDEVRRIIREQDPPKPSTKISTLGDQAKTVCAQRRTDVRTLSKFVTGDLDIIAMKALEKDRTRRYDTASALAADVKRFLNSEPIVARPPSLTYRFSRFARRNRASLLAAALVFCALIAGIVTTTWMWRVAVRTAQSEAQLAAKLRERIAEQKETLRKLAESSRREAMTAALAGNPEKARRALEIAREAGASNTDRLVVEGLIELSAGKFDEAMRIAQQLLEDNSQQQASRKIESLALLSAAASWAGYTDEWVTAMQKLQPLKPRGESDYLLKAYALLLPDPENGLKLLGQAPRVQHSTVGLFMRSQANLLMGIDKQDAQILESVIQDLDYVEFLFNSNQSVLAWKAYAAAAAVELARSESRPDDETRYLNGAREAADTLESMEGNPFIDSCLYHYFRTCGENDRAYRAVRRVGNSPSNYCGCVATACLQRYDMSTALQEFMKAIPEKYQQGKYFRVTQAQFAPGDADRAQKVKSLVDDLIDDSSPFVRRSALFALCLVCEPAELHEYALRAASRVPEERSGEMRLFAVSDCLEYLADRLGEDELLEKTSGRAYSTAMAHFTIAMKCVSAGQRDAARRHFEAAVKTNTINSNDYEWARGYLKCMDADPDWPDWKIAGAEN